MYFPEWANLAEISGVNYIGTYRTVVSDEYDDVRSEDSSIEE